jgi:hypothetical protein
VKKGGVFESDMMLAQLRYAGLLEVCRIRKIGFPVRKVFSEFIFRYRCLDLLAAKAGHKELCAAMEKLKILEPRQWAIGHTKVFMRNLQQTKCEAAREGALMGVAMDIDNAGQHPAAGGIEALGAGGRGLGPARLGKCQGAGVQPIGAEHGTAFNRPGHHAPSTTSCVRPAA